MDQAQKKSINFDWLNWLALALVAWPGVVWYVQRSLDHSDEPCGILALISLCALAFWRARQTKIGASTNFSIVVPVLVLYVLTYALAPHLVASLLVAFLLWFVLVQRLTAESKASYLGLAALSLPLISSLNFYFGFPLRVIIAFCTCVILSAFGLSAQVDGAMLSLDGKLVAIDAPCSGVGMLWTALFVAMFCSAICRLKNRPTIFLGALAIFAVVAGNIWRATTLVLFDSLQSKFNHYQIPDIEPVVHMSAGICTFLIICALIIFLSFKFEKRQNVAYDNANNREDQMRLPVSWNCRAGYLLLPLCLASALLPIFTTRSNAVQTAPPAVNWPSEINGQKVVAAQTLGEEEAFARDFPGQMRRFTDGTNSYFVRVAYRETRQLHSSSDCFRGMGYSVEPGPIQIGVQQSHWGSFVATKQEQKYEVLERIVDESGQSWTDVSAWYWSVVASRTHGPWTAVTIARRLN